MAQVFTQTLGNEVDPYAAMIEAQRAQLQKPMAPAYTPEQQQQRVSQNEREYLLGMAAALSGDEGIAGVGGHVLKNAMAARAPRVTERGVADPLRGTFTYSPDYLREQDEAKLTKLEANQASAANNRYMATQAQQAQRDNLEYKLQEQKAFHAAIAANRPEPLQAVIGPDGSPVLIPRSQAVGMKPFSAGGNPTEGERKAASLLQRLQFSQQQYQAAIEGDPSAALPRIASRAAGAVPLMGEDLANTVNSPARQQVEAAQLDMLDAALTLGTGAAYTREQLKGYARSYFPQVNDDTKTIVDKQARLNNVIRAAQIAAGRAAPAAAAGAGGGGGGGGANAADPLNMDALFPQFSRGAPQGR